MLIVYRSRSASRNDSCNFTARLNNMVLCVEKIVKLNFLPKLLRYALRSKPSVERYQGKHLDFEHGQYFTEQVNKVTVSRVRGFVLNETLTFQGGRSKLYQ